MHQNTVPPHHGALASAPTSAQQERVARSRSPNQTTSSQGFTRRSPADHTSQGLCPPQTSASWPAHTPSHLASPPILVTLPTSLTFLPCAQKGLTATTAAEKAPDVMSRKGGEALRPLA